MEMKTFALAAIAVCSLAASGNGQVPSTATTREPEVVASATADAHVPPTYASINISVATRTATAADAVAQNAARVASVRAALQRAGIPTDDITTQGYSLEQAFDDNGRRRAGFTARNSLQVRSNRIDQIGTVLDAAINAGATDVSSIQYGSANMEDARRAAMSDAVKRARADAAVIASAAGGTLGRLISITSTSGVPSPFGGVQLESVMTTAGGAPTVITPRDLIAVAHASGRWEFVPAPAR